MTGFPCYHSGYILVHLDKIRSGHNDPLACILRSSYWRYDHKIWYSEIFSVDNLVLQYSAPVLCNVPVDYDNLIRDRILPPGCRRRKGRKKKGRDSRKKYATNEATELSDEESSSESDESSTISIHDDEYVFSEASNEDDISLGSYNDDVVAGFVETSETIEEARQRFVFKFLN